MQKQVKNSPETFSQAVGWEKWEEFNLKRYDSKIDIELDLGKKDGIGWQSNTEYTSG